MSTVTSSWRKTRRSMNNGNCAEVGYRKSSASYSSGGCVEVGAGTEILVRDTKQDGQPDRTVLAFSAGAWRAFTRLLRDSRL